MTEQEFIDTAVRDQAARAMLAALKTTAHLLPGVGKVNPHWLAEVRAAIAAAKAAGIKAEG